MKKGFLHLREIYCKIIIDIGIVNNFFFFYNMININISYIYINIKSG